MPLTVPGSKSMEGEYGAPASEIDSPSESTEAEAPQGPDS